MYTYTHLSGYIRSRILKYGYPPNGYFHDLMYIKMQYMSGIDACSPYKKPPYQILEFQISTPTVAMALEDLVRCVPITID